MTDRYPTVVVTRASVGTEEFHDVQDLHIETTPQNLKEINLRVVPADGGQVEERQMGREDLQSICFNPPPGPT